MKIKLDENLPVKLVPRLTALGHQVHTPREESLSGARDLEVWEAAQREARFLITQDLDFSDTRRFVPGAHAGILLVRLQNPSRAALIQRIEALFQSENVAEWSGCFVVVTESKVRIRRPVRR